MTAGTTRTIAAVVAALALLGACSGEEEPPPAGGMAATADPGPLPSPTVDAQRWRSIDDMVAVLEAGGIEIVNFDGGPGDHESLKDFRSLQTEDANFDIYLFRNSKDRDMWLPQMRGTLEVIYGPNWVVVPFAMTREILPLLGGEVAGPSEDS